MKQLINKRAIVLETISGKKIIRDARGVVPLSTTVTPTQLVQSGKGNFTVGMYRGNLAVLDLDALVNQPLVLAEQQYVLGLLKGDVEGYDLKTVHFSLVNPTSPEGTILRARLTVPANQVWFISAVDAKSVTGIAEVAGVDVNWRCSIWPDLFNPAQTPPVAADADGGAIQDGDKAGTAPGGVAGITNEINSSAVFGPGYTYPLLRLPAGASITAVFTTNTGALTVSAVGTLALTGYVGKALVK